MINWQPIETAPKDGVRVLVTDGKMIGVQWFECGSWGWHRTPTHWAPINLPDQQVSESTATVQNNKE